MSSHLNQPAPKKPCLLREDTVQKKEQLTKLLKQAFGVVIGLTDLLEYCYDECHDPNCNNFCSSRNETNYAEREKLEYAYCELVEMTKRDVKEVKQYREFAKRHQREEESTESTETVDTEASSSSSTVKQE